MKKLILIAITGIMFTSCAKDVKAPTDERQPRTVNVTANENPEGTGGIKAVRGIATVVAARDAAYEYILQFNDFEWHVPTNLPKQFMVPGMRVDVAYYFTEKEVPGNFRDAKYYIEIVDISEPSQPNNQ